VLEQHLDEVEVEEYAGIIVALVLGPWRLPRLTLAAVAKLTSSRTPRLNLKVNASSEMHSQPALVCDPEYFRIIDRIHLLKGF
jgi:hypothetical protein